MEGLHGVCVPSQTPRRLVSCRVLADDCHQDLLHSAQPLHYHCRYIGHVAGVLQGLKESLPERAAPVAADLLSQVERGHEKCAKYETRSGVQGFLRAKNEAVRIGC